ncbi:MAG: sn-glycerol-1-phosphate dehydrogenase [Acidilobaceae archaeon]
MEYRVSENEHQIDLPKRIVVGKGILERAGSYFTEVFGKRGLGVLVVTGPNVKTSLYPVLKQALEDEGLSVWDAVVSEASLDVAMSVLQEIDSSIDVIIGFGGGKSIDVAKYSAKLSKRPFVSVPTTTSHDGIASPYASLKGFERPLSKPAKPPDLIMVDLEAVLRAPRRYNVAGFGDLVGKLTAVRDWRLASLLKGEYYGEYSATISLTSAKHAMNKYRELANNTVEGFKVLVEGLISSGIAMCIAGSSRPASGSEHLIAHAISLVSKNPPLHGEAVAVGTVIAAGLHGINWRKIKSVLKSVGLPTTAKELGISDEELVEAISIAPTIRPERYTILGDKQIDLEVAHKLAARMEVIEV